MTVRQLQSVTDAGVLCREGVGDDGNGNLNVCATSLSFLAARTSGAAKSAHCNACAAVCSVKAKQGKGGPPGAGGGD